MRGAHTHLAHTRVFRCARGYMQTHRDACHVGGRSRIIAVGDYEGGELWVEGRGLLDVHNKWIDFDGRHQHRTEPFTGERYSLVRTFYLVLLMSALRQFFALCRFISPTKVHRIRHFMHLTAVPTPQLCCCAEISRSLACTGHLPVQTEEPDQRQRGEQGQAGEEELHPSNWSRSKKRSKKRSKWG